MSWWTMSTAIAPRAARSGVIVAALLVGSAVNGACAGGSPPGESDRPVVMATTGIWADVVSHLTCDGQAKVESLLPAGADPHDVELSMADRARLSEADLVVANGLGLEGPIAAALDSVGDEGVPVVEVGSLVRPRRTSSGAVDPHLWTDPGRVLEAVPGLVDALVSDAGLSRDRVRACAERFTGELDALDDEVRAELHRVPSDRRLLVTGHDSLGYLADRYGYEVVGTVVPSASTLAETNPADLERLARRVERLGVPAVFAEAGLSRGDAEAVARETGTRVVVLSTDVLGAPGSPTGTYAAMMRTTARRIAGALGGGSDGDGG